MNEALDHASNGRIDGRRHSRTESYIALWPRIGALLVGFLLLDRIIPELAGLEADNYAEPVLILELIQTIGSRFSILAPVGPALLAIGFFYVTWRLRRRLWTSWSALGVTRPVRVVVLTVAFLLAWTFATYDTNLFFGQLHLFDRLALIGLVGLSAWRPVFVGPFVVLQIAIMGQLGNPWPTFSTAEPRSLVDILVLFVAFFTIRVLIGWMKARDFVFVMFVMVASSYWVAGFGKLRIGWITHGHMERLLAATYANGWLGFLEPETIESITSVVAAVDWPLRIFALVAEAGAIIALRRRSTLMVWLLMWAGMHTGIVLLTGIFFWKWLALDLVLFVFVWRHQNPEPMFTRPHFLLAVGLIFTSSVWLQPVNLTWYNSQISYTYRFVATGESGEQYSLAPQFFAPYDYHFTIGLFAYLSEHPLLPVAWGAANNRSAADASVAPNDLAGLAAIELELGYEVFDEQKSLVFDNLIETFVAEANDRESKSDWISYLSPTPQLLTFERDDAFHGEEDITIVTVLLVTSQFADGTYSEIRTEVVREIAIAG